MVPGHRRRADQQARSTRGAGLNVADFPKTIDGLPALCKTLKDKTGTVCDIRLTVNDLLAQMVYEGNVKVISDDGKTFTFDSADAVTWLQMYVDMVKAGTVDNTSSRRSDDRVGLLIFSAGQAPFYADRPEPDPRRQVEQPDALRQPGRRAGAGRQVRRRRQGPDGHLGQGATRSSRTRRSPSRSSSRTRGAWSSSPSRSRSTRRRRRPTRIRSSRPRHRDRGQRPTARQGHRLEVRRHRADLPKKADVNEIVLKAVESALFNKVPAQQALTDAVAKANALIK